MAVDSYIRDPQTKIKAEVNNVDGTEKNALVVASRPLKVYSNKVRFFASDNYGIDMNISVLPSGSPERIHNGTDDVLWTLTEVVGDKITEDSGDRFYAGTKSVKWDNGAVDDVVQFTTTQSVTASDWTSFTMWMNIDKDWKAGDSIQLYAWDTGTTNVVGNAVNLQDYVSWGEFDVWHKITIPFTAMALTGTFDAIRIRIVSAEGKAPKMYMDDIQFEEAVERGSPEDFKIIPGTGIWLYVDVLSVMIVDDYDSTLANSTMPKLSYDKLLSVDKLDTGITYKRVENGVTKFSYQIRQLMDILQLPGFDSMLSGSDGVNTWIRFKLNVIEPLVLKPEENSYVAFTVNDDLSGLTVLRAAAGCREEERI